MDTLKVRDQKELYTKIEKGEVKNVLGVDMQIEFLRWKGMAKI